MKTRIFFLAALLILTVPFLPSAEETRQVFFPKKKQGLTLPEVLTAFESGNPRMKILEGRLETARAENQKSKLWPNPEIGYRIEDSADKDTFIEASWPIDITGRRWMQRKAANAGISAAENLHRWEINSLLAEVKTHFYELLAAQERLKNAEEGARRYESILNNIRSRSGSTDYDRLRLEKEVSEVKADADEIRREVIGLQSEYAVFLDKNPNELNLSGGIKPDLTVPARESLEASILSNHPKIAAALKEAEKRGYERKAARRKWFPELNLSGGFKNTSGEETDENGYVAGVSVSLPLFDRGQADRAAANGELKTAESEAVIAKAEITQRFAKTYQNILLLKNSVQEYETALLTAERLEQMAGLAYLEGRLGILELLDAYQGATQSRIRYLNLVLEARISEIDLERIMGRPLGTLTEEKK